MQITARCSSGARHKSKREVEHLVATLSPSADVPSTVRKLPVPTGVKPPTTATTETLTRDEPASVDTAARFPTTMRPQVKPLAPERYKIQFTVTAKPMNNCATYKIY